MSNQPTPENEGLPPETTVCVPRLLEQGKDIPPPAALPRLAFTMREASQVLGVSYITIHRLLKRGLLRSHSALRTKLISRAEIERFLRN